MTDFRSIEHLEVVCDDVYVADLRRLAKGCSFQYTTAFLASHREPIALHLPLEGVTVEGIANLPTYFAGLLPEGVMFNAVKTLIGAAADDLFAVLAATGSDAIGNIEVRVKGEHERRPVVDAQQAADVIADLLAAQSRGTAVRVSAISGVQPKLSIGELTRASRLERYIAKFNAPEFPGMLANEFACMRLAKKCRMQVAEATLTQDFLMVKRFDRHVDNKAREVTKLHQEDLLQVMDLFPNSKYSLEFGDLLQAMENLGASKVALLRALELYVYSYLIGNGDLHAKNVSLILDRATGQWNLSPAYDLLSTLPYRDQLPGAERMALALAEESFGRFTLIEFLAVGERFGLPERAVATMVGGVSSRVQANLSMLAMSGFSEEVLHEISQRAQSLTA